MTRVAAYTAVAGPNLMVEVDLKGNVQLAVRAQRKDLPMGMGDLVDPVDGYARSDVTHVAGLAAALASAQVFAEVVFPRADAGRTDLEFTWQQRRDAYHALQNHGKVDIKGPAQAAKVLTEFLREYRDAEKMADQGYREHMTINSYAEGWEHWW